MTVAAPSQSVGATPAGRRRRSRRNGPTWSSLIYIAPALAFFAVFVIYPIGISVQTSFYNYDGLTVATPAGVSNYVNVFTDPDLRAALGHSLLLLVFYCALPVCIGLVLAGAMSRIRIYGLTLFRALLFLPQILSSVVVAVAWRGLLASDGPVNWVLAHVGLGSLTTSWLGDFDTALPSIGLIGTWVEYGLCMVLFLAGIVTIDRSLYEAVRLDGAGPVREFFAITLPALRPQISIALILTITFALRNFDLIWNTTRGGPGTSTTVPSLYVYLDAFQNRQLGQASALAVVLTVIILIIVALVQLAVREPSDTPRRVRSKGASR
ncbi:MULTISPECIES: carbohydrate ABC transporter permease [unclassified Frondihabitans]|uniref:carbohydrate ABC transporter permease n=1 Tax=unclassified Frondihabitans TaxID=2626248 RepID=UPI000F4F52FB|nr:MULTISPECIES: sugar ABC transporter permease [unclassified Frondihabitans]RPE76036.1 raffinose/stachyose/melibiose transport system permease protein [Frondihabitans sp. PhB153]RPF05687.1 raffinose/stachyose/melibiose transport system permease protein [Frondihabitans sp. PhB161]